VASTGLARGRASAPSSRRGCATRSHPPAPCRADAGRSAASKGREGPPVCQHDPRNFQDGIEFDPVGRPPVRRARRSRTPPR
jgi:hypothetical protein